MDEMIVVPLEDDQVAEEDDQEQELTYLFIWDKIVRLSVSYSQSPSPSGQRSPELLGDEGHQLPGGGHRRLLLYQIQTGPHLQSDRRDELQTTGQRDGECLCSRGQGDGQDHRRHPGDRQLEVCRPRGQRDKQGGSMGRASSADG